MHGEEFILPYGPQHPSLSEPIMLRLRLDGENIIDAKLEIGYMHRGIEKMLEGQTPEKGIFVCERICGICPVSHSTCYTLAVEQASNENVEEKIEYLRMLLMELERIHSHLVCLGLQMHDMGYDTLFMFLWRERERVLNIFEELTGGRVQHCSNRIGSINFDINGRENWLLSNVEKAIDNIKRYKEEYIKNEVIRERTAEIGTISHETAKKMNLVGPVARASGVKQDIRIHDPYLRYNELEYGPVVMSDGDVYTRNLLRIDEILKSSELIKEIMNLMPKKEIKTSKMCKMINEQCQGMERVEAPRGELFYFVEIENNQIKRCRMRPPTYAYISVAEPLLKGHTLGDVPVIISSLDPCIACLDRVMIEDKNEKRILDKNEFRKRCGLHVH